MADAETDAENLVRRICLSFPEVQERLSHGHPCWFVQGKKQFAAFHWSHHDVERVHIWCAAPAGAQAALIAARPERYFRPPYVGHRGWLGVYLDDEIDHGELEGLLTEAYLVVCPPRLQSAMTAAPFVPPDFEPPKHLTTDRFRLEPLGPQHNVSDLKAWSSSIEHIRNTAGYPDGDWPPLSGMSLEANLADLTRHAADFEARKGFTFTVLDRASGEVMGCVYLYPSRSQGHDVSVQSWVSAARAELDGPLADAVHEWLLAAWPWRRLQRYGR